MCLWFACSYEVCRFLAQQVDGGESVHAGVHVRKTVQQAALAAATPAGRRRALQAHRCVRHPPEVIQLHRKEFQNKRERNKRADGENGAAGGRRRAVVYLRVVDSSVLRRCIEDHHGNEVRQLRH